MEAVLSDPILSKNWFAGSETVKIIDNFSTGKRENVEPFRDDVKSSKPTLPTHTNLAEILKGADYVIHQAAIPSVPKSILDPVKSHQANVNGTLNVLIACARCRSEARGVCVFIVVVWRQPDAAKT